MNPEENITHIGVLQLGPTGPHCLCFKHPPKSKQWADGAG